MVLPLSDQQLDELRFSLANVAPFGLTYGPLTSIGPHPGVVFAITPESAFFTLRAVIQSTSIFAGRDAHRGDRFPHMTITEFISLEETHYLLAELRDAVSGGSFFCDHVVCAVPDATFHFEPVLTVPVGCP